MMTCVMMTCECSYALLVLLRPCGCAPVHRRPIDQAVKLVPLQEPPATHSSDPTNNATSSNTLLWQELQLPPPLLQASLSAEVADKLQLQRLRIGQNQQQQQQSLPHSPLPQSTAAPAGGSRAVTGQQSVHEVSVARLQALLTLQSGSWCLEAVPSGPRPEAVAAVLARQQHPQQELLWGTLDTIQLLADLQVTPCSWGRVLGGVLSGRPRCSLETSKLVVWLWGVLMLHSRPPEVASCGAVAELFCQPGT